jgi:hypothetical protein
MQPLNSTPLATLIQDVCVWGDTSRYFDVLTTIHAQNSNFGNDYQIASEDSVYSFSKKT